MAGYACCCKRRSVVDQRAVDEGFFDHADLAGVLRRLDKVGGEGTHEQQDRQVVEVITNLLQQCRATQIGKVRFDQQTVVTCMHVGPCIQE